MYYSLTSDQSIRANLTQEMWFEHANSSMRYKITVQMNNATNEEILELARLNWDSNVNGIKSRPISARP